MSAAPNLTDAEREALNAVTASGSWALVYAVVSDLLQRARTEGQERLAQVERERDAWKRTADMRSSTGAAERLLAIEAAFDAYPGTTRLHRAAAAALGRPSAGKVEEARSLDFVENNATSQIDPAYAAAKERVRARGELRQLAAERARANISPEWRKHYAAQFARGAEEAQQIVAAWAVPAPSAEGLPTHEHGVFNPCTKHCPAHAGYVDSDLPEVIDFLMQVFANEPGKSGLDALLDALEVFRQ